MKNINKTTGLLALLFTAFGCVDSVEKKNDSPTKHNYSAEIQKLWRGISLISSKMDSLMTNGNDDLSPQLLATLHDSLKKNNKKIVSFLIEHAAKFNVEDMAEIKKNTDIRLISSPDKEVVFYSWDNGFNDRVSSYNNVLVYATSKSKAAIHYSVIDTSDAKFGNNLMIDSVFELTINNRKTYLIAKSNMLPIAFMYNSLTSLRLTDNNFIEHEYVFKKNDLCFNQISCAYYLNENIKKPISFEFNSRSNEILSPLLDQTNSTIVGKNIYVIQNCR